jgi:hypothetical protein
MKGVFVSLSETDRSSYAVKVDAQGRITDRQKLSMLAPENLNGRAPAPGAAGRGRGPGVLPLPSGLNMPGMLRPTGAYKPGEANEFEVILSGNALRLAFNGGALGGGNAGAADPSAGAYGPFALYAGGTRPAQFKDLTYKDLESRPDPPEKLSSNFTMRRLNEFYYTWSAAIADVNRDGIPDILAGPYYYLGPNYDVAHEIYTPVAYNPTVDYPQVNMVNLAYDFTGDGWPDVLIMSGNAGNGTGTLYVNPKGEYRRWEQHVVLEPVGNEETLLKDIDGDGKPEVIHAGNNALRYSKPDPANPTGKWITKTISEPGPWGANIGHGLGVGDINGDGLMDYVNAYGWWEHPAKGTNPELWTHHPEEFGRWGHSQGGAGGAEIGIYDVNGDGLVDVVTSLEGHGFGLAWFEQKRDAAGKISFVRHIIMDNFLTKNAGDVMFTEPHATAFADMDGDGIPDLITGKRAMSHLFTFSDPDSFGPPVLYWYRTVRNKNAPGGAEFVPELIHNRSGAGSHFAVADLNKDGTPDIVTAGVDGIFVFFNHIKARR